MKIKFYGTSHGLPEKDRFCTSVLIEAGENHYLVDAGAPIADLLIRDELKLSDVKSIFITHLHGDHVDGLVEYLDLASWAYKDTDPEIFTPSLYLRDAIDAWMKLEFRKPPREFKFREICEGDLYSDEFIRVRAYKTEHQMHDYSDFKRNSYGFAIEEISTGKKVLFTGDLCDNMEDIPSVVFTEHFDTIVTEGAHPEIDECSDILGKCLTDRFIIGHVAPNVTTPEKAARLTAQISTPVIISEDGMVFEL